jgi:FG-GAP repeat/LytTr DNA-binding domain
MKKLFLKTSCGDYLIDTSAIVRVEASSNYSKIFFSDGKMMVTAKLLSWFEEKLPPQSFTRMHRSHLINKNYLHLHQHFGKSVEMQNGNSIPVSRRRKKMVWQKLAAACLLFFICSSAFSQSVGVGTNSPHASAALDIVSNNKGMSIPSLTTAQRTAIASPKAGLFVFDTDRQTLCMFNGSNWVYFQSSVEPNVTHPVEQVASDGEVGDEFGHSVAISSNYAIVGAPNDNIGANSNQGSAYIFFFNGTGWVEQAKLVAVGGASDDNFGYSVSISGDYAIVGAPNDNVGASSNQGSAYIFIRSGTAWTQQANFTGISALANDNFGRSVSIDGDYAAIGAPGDDVGANTNQGTAYVFIRSGVSWTEEDKKTIPSGAASDAFGTSVSISGIYLIVGAPYDDVSGTTGAGSAHIFQRIGTAWSHIQVLTFINSEDYHFGYSVSISGNYMVVGAPDEGPGGAFGNGRAYIFNGLSWVTTDNGNWLVTILGLDHDIGDRFCFSVSTGGNYIIVGAPNSDTVATLSGRAYLLQTDGTDWYFVRNILDPLGGAIHLMGSSTAVSASACVMGSPIANGQKGKVLFLKL